MHNHCFKQHDHGRMIPRLLFICSKCDKQIYVWFEKKYHQTYVEKLSNFQECFLFFNESPVINYGSEAYDNIVALSNDGNEFSYLRSDLDNCPISNDEAIVKGIIK